MPSPNSHPGSLRTPEGEFPLAEYRLRLGGREWGILHAGSVLTLEEEQHFLSELRDVLPYGVALWPAALALAHDIVARPDAFHGRRVLELGAGTGLPGIVAASLGARVVQTDRHELPMGLCRRNGERNGIADGVARHGPSASPIEYRLVDWAAWDDAERYDWILGADVLYGETGHPELRRIFDANLAPGGRLLLSDPFRSASIRLLEAMEADGWSVAGSRWSVGDAAPGEDTRPVGVFELTRPQ